MSLRTKSIVDSIKNEASLGPITLVEYQPGNGTRYILQIVDYTDLTLHPNQRVKDATKNMGFSGVYTVASMCDGKGTVMTVHPGGYLAPSYVMEKLKVGEADARVLAEVIAHFTHSKADDASEHRR